jgi:hypothetical protein
MGDIEVSRSLNETYRHIQLGIQISQNRQGTMDVEPFIQNVFPDEMEFQTHRRRKSVKLKKVRNFTVRTVKA